jgi:uncharacterized protein
MTRIAALFVFCLTLVLAPAGQAAQLSFPQLSGRVVDEARLLDAGTRERIDAKLAALETRTGRQLVVVTLPSLQGREIEDYGYQLGRHWGIGERDRDTGALLIVAPRERRVRVEVGYGLEGILTDAVSRLVIENGILPRFRVNDYAGGIERGVDDLVQVLSGDAEDFQRRATERSGPAGTQVSSEGIWWIIIIGIWLFFMLRSRRRRRRALWGAAPPIFFPPIGGRRGGWGGGGGFGGGFRGGGGSFGGGGASGRW